MFEYKDIVLEDSDLDTLRDPCYLTDKVIAFYFTYLSSSTDKTVSSFLGNCVDDILLVAPSISFWLANCGDDAVSEFAESCKLSTKKLALFAVNDCDDLSGGDSGSHWSILVYSRAMNAFLHFDSMQGVNSDSAMKLYDAVKNHTGPGGGLVSKPTPSKKLKNKKKTATPVVMPVDAIAVTGLPVFRECETPQQTNGYDCGIYVLSIARVVCHWFLHETNTKGDLCSVIASRVDQSVEGQMRDEVLGIIQRLSRES